MVPIAILIFFLSVLPVSANVHICKIDPLAVSGSEWIQLCNDSQDTNQDLSGYTLQDAANHQITLNCILPFGKSYSIAFSGINNDNEYLSIKNNEDNIIDCISYGNQTCPVNDIHLPNPQQKKCFLFTSSWENTDDCSSSGTQYCIVNTSTPIPSLTPLPSPTVTSTSTPTPSPTVTVSPTPAPAISISISSLPDSVKLGDSFSLEFNIQDANPSAAYYVKAFGGTTDNFSIQTQSNNNWYNFNSSWDSFSQFATDTNGHLQSSLTVRAKPDQETGQYQLKIKLKQVDGSQEKESQAKEISIFAPDPSNTPTPTPTPTSTPALIFTTPSVTPTRTRTPTPTPTLPATTARLSAGPSPISTPVVLGQTTISSPSSLPKSSTVATIAKILMALGTLMLLVPAVIAKIKRC